MRFTNFYLITNLHCKTSFMAVFLVLFKILTYIFQYFQLYYIIAPTKIEKNTCLGASISIIFYINCLLQIQDLNVCNELSLF